MIDRSYGKLVFECDSCPEVLETDTADFSEAWDMARADGWKAKQIGVDWLHGCAKCGVPG